VDQNIVADPCGPLQLKDVSIVAAVVMLLGRVNLGANGEGVVKEDALAELNVVVPELLLRCRFRLRSRHKLVASICLRPSCLARCT
jgi:hypothetical protein